MKLKYCSITGADDDVAVDDLNAIAEEYPFVEYAVLLLPERAGTARFPSYDWIRNFSQEYTGANTAMHLCEEAFLGFIEGRKDILELMRGFKRIQLNLKFGDVEGRYDPKKLLSRVEESPEWQFIIQYSKDKKNLLPLLKYIPNHAVLFDDSAGAGISPDKWDAPLEGHFCGYAGGINPDNVQANIEMINKAAPENYITWIDMESGVRTDNVFDLDKVRRVLEIAQPYSF